MVLADPDGAADAIQKAFTGMVAKRGRIDSNERYLRRAVRNECFTQLRARSKRVSMSDAPIVQAVAPNIDVAERITLEQAIRALPPDQREVLHLKEFEGMTFQEIADLIGESIDTVASRHRYALEKMRAHFGATGGR